MKKPPYIKIETYLGTRYLSPAVKRYLTRMWKNPVKIFFGETRRGKAFVYEIERAEVENLYTWGKKGKDKTFSIEMRQVVKEPKTAENMS